MTNLYEKLTNGIIKTAVTHSGPFHSDDVFATALLLNINPDISIVRTNDITKSMKEDESVLIFDIGCGEYDHHDPNNKQYRPALGDDNPVQYAAFGLLWRDLGERVMGSKLLADKFDEIFVRFIDLTDNTGIQNLLSSQINMYKPTWDSNDSMDERFTKAVRVAREMIANDIANLTSTSKAETYISSFIRQDPDFMRAVVLPKFAPYNSYISTINDNIDPDESILFVLFPSARSGGWCVKTVKDAIGEDLVKFPEEWFSTKPQGLTFLHKDRFLADFDTLYNAKAAVKKLLA